MHYNTYHHYSYFSMKNIGHANINILYFGCLVNSIQKKTCDVFALMSKYIDLNDLI